MGKKTYKAVAAILKKRYELASPECRPQLEWAMQDMALYFQDKDKAKKFDYDKFMAACGHPRFQNKEAKK